MNYKKWRWQVISLLLAAAMPVVAGMAQMDPRGALIRVQPEVNFGPVAVGTTATYNYVFTNLTGERATINSVGFDDFVTVYTQDPPHPARAVFEVTGLALPTTLAPGGQFRFTIRFTPPGVGTYRPKNTLIICVTTYTTRQHIHYYIPLVGQGIGGQEEVVPPGALTFDSFTDQAGRFSVSIPILPNTAITGTLTECTVRLLPQTRVSVTLVPKPGITTITRADQIGAVRVSSPGYAETTVTQLLLASSMDMFGRVHTTVGVGTVCLRPTAPPMTLPPVPPTGPIAGKTGGDGKFTVSPLPDTTVTGTLTECGNIPLPNQEFTLTLVPKGEMIATADDIAGFTFSVPGYATTTVTKFSRLSLFGLTWYDTGPVCLLAAVGCEEIPLRILTQNTKRLTYIALGRRDPTLPARELDIFALLRGPLEYNFDIVCLQEWFQDAGPEGAVGLESWATQKGPLLRHWLGAEPDLTERSVENTIVGTVRIVDARPNDLACEIVVGDNYVAGPDAAWFLETRIDGGLVILVRPGLRIIRASAFVFRQSDGWDWYASKGALYARVQLDPHNSACYLHVFTTHLQAGNARSDQDIRVHQLEELIRFVERCTSDDRVQNQVQHPILLCGDFNIIGGSPEWKNRLQNLGAAGVKFEDIWLKAGNEEGKGGATWVGNDHDTTGTPWGNPGGRKEGNVLATEEGTFQRLDYIFFWPGLKPVQLQLLSVAREPEKPGDQPYRWGNIASHTISDHLGVVGLFKVSPK